MTDGVTDNIVVRGCPGSIPVWVLKGGKKNKSIHLIYVLYILYVIISYMHIIYLIYCIYMESQKCVVYK